MKPRLAIELTAVIVCCLIGFLGGTIEARRQNPHYVKMTKAYESLIETNNSYRFVTYDLISTLKGFQDKEWCGRRDEVK